MRCTFASIGLDKPCAKGVYQKVAGSQRLVCCDFVGCLLERSPFSTLSFQLCVSKSLAGFAPERNSKGMIHGMMDLLLRKNASRAALCSCGSRVVQRAPQRISYSFRRHMASSLQLFLWTFQLCISKSLAGFAPEWNSKGMMELLLRKNASRASLCSCGSRVVQRAPQQISYSFRRHIASSLQLCLCTLLCPSSRFTVML